MSVSSASLRAARVTREVALAASPRVPMLDRLKSTPRLGSPKEDSVTIGSGLAPLIRFEDLRKLCHGPITTAPGKMVTAASVTLAYSTEMPKQSPTDTGQSTSAASHYGKRPSEPINNVDPSGLEPIALSSTIRANLRSYVRDSRFNNAGTVGTGSGSRRYQNCLQPGVGDNDKIGERLGRQLPPGVNTVVAHGRNPYEYSDKSISSAEDLATKIFVDENDNNITASQLADNSKDGLAEGPIMVFACDAGTDRSYTDSSGKTVVTNGAQQYSNATGRIVIAPVNGEANVTRNLGVRFATHMGQPATPAPYWGVFIPGGQSPSEL